MPCWLPSPPSGRRRAAARAVGGSGRLADVQWTDLMEQDASLNPLGPRHYVGTTPAVSLQHLGERSREREGLWGRGVGGPGCLDKHQN